MRNLIFIVLMICIPGCAPNKPTIRRTDWRSANIHKVIIVLAQGNRRTSQRVESIILPMLRHQGFDAVAAKDFFPAASAYSPKELKDLMLRAGFDGIMEIAYSGEIPANGLPQQVRFKYHTLKGQPVNLSDHYLDLDSALVALIGT